MADLFRSNDFTPYLNQTFRVLLEGTEPISLELVEVMEAGASTGSDARIPFSLFFLGPVSSQYLTQRIYRLEHSQIGALDIFLVPLGPEEGRMRYEAVFN